jgi:hypothetical protein
MNMAVWLYGSHARGDADATSDLDVLVVSRDAGSPIDIATLVPMHPAPSLSMYNWCEITRMASYGSLFLHHVRLEGRSIYEDPAVRGALASLLERMPPYQKAAVDLNSFRRAVRDVRYSLSHDGSPVFEASVLATVLRHSAILGCYVGGFPAFGRAEPVFRTVAAWRLDPAIAAGFLDLYQFRIRAEGRSDESRAIAPAEVLQWCDHVDSLLGALEEHVHDYEKRLQAESRLGYRSG